jgi:hypothetical protein
MGQVSVDLAKAHLTRQHGDLMVIFTWVNDERSMILVPAHRKGAAWYIVCESAAYKYDNMEYLKRQCQKAAEVLGMEPSPNNWYKLATVIHDGLPDLITMPTAPDKDLTRGNYGQMELRADGKTMVAQDIKLEKEEGATYGSV